jgi:hypothetical protein
VPAAAAEASIMPPPPVPTATVEEGEATPGRPPLGALGNADRGRPQR